MGIVLLGECSSFASVIKIIGIRSSLNYEKFELYVYLNIYKIMTNN